MHRFVKYLQSIQNALWSPISKSPIFFLTYAILLFIPELFTVVAHNRIEYFGGHLFNNFIIYAVVSYFLVLIGSSLKKCKLLYVAYTLLIHIVLYVYSIGDLFCVKILSTRYTGATLQLIFQTNTKEASGFVETYLFTKPFLQILIFYIFFGTVEFICSWLSLSKISKIVCDIVGRWWKSAAMIYACYFTISCFPYFGSDYDNVWKEVYWSGKEIKIKDNTLWQLNIGIRRFLNTKQDLDNLLNACSCVDSVTCKYDSSCIVLIIGESYNRHHAHIYGYPLQTTPMMEKYNPIIFTDVISPVNRTNESFRNFLTPVRSDSAGSWSKTPIFPAIFKKGGYNVVFYSNQFAFIDDNADIYFWGSSFYLNHPDLNQMCFSHRNTEFYDYDMELVDSYRNKRNDIETDANDLIIFHLRGQHFIAKNNYPSTFSYFTHDSISQNLSDEQKQSVAEYDNATRYNDYVVNNILEMFANKDALVIYFSDHADEVHDCRNQLGRAFDFESCNWDVMRYQLDIPFLIFPTNKYKESHPEIVSQLENASQTRFMIDDLPHLMMYLGGIDSPWYQDSRNPLSDTYDKNRHRMVSADGEHYNIDYDAH